MNPLTNEELIKDCEMALSYFDMSDEVSKRFCELLNRFRKLTQPEQVSGEVENRLMDAIAKASHEVNGTTQWIVEETEKGIEHHQVDDTEFYILESKLRHAIQTALNGKIDKR